MTMLIAPLFYVYLRKKSSEDYLFTTLTVFPAVLTM